MDELHYCVARAESQPARIEGGTGKRWIVNECAEVNCALCGGYFAERPLEKNVLANDLVKRSVFTPHRLSKSSALCTWRESDATDKDCMQACFSVAVFAYSEVRYRLTHIRA